MMIFSRKKKFLSLPSDRDREEINNLASLMENKAITFDELAQKFSAIGEANITYALLDHRWLMNPTLREPAQHWLRMIEGERQERVIRAADRSAFATELGTLVALIACIIALFCALYGQDELMDKFQALAEVVENR